MASPSSSPVSAPPPPPPLPAAKIGPAPPPATKSPVVTSSGPGGSFLVELMIYNGSPFKDHWAFWVSSHADRTSGVLINAAGDVKYGFKFEISRSHEFDATKKIPLQWVDGKYFNKKAMLNDGNHKLDDRPVCAFKASVHQGEAPGKSLNLVEDKVSPGKKINQRNCQTWIVEAADQLVKDNIFSLEVAAYLHAVKQ